MLLLKVCVAVGGMWRRAVLLLKVCIVVGGVAEVAGEGSEQTNENMAQMTHLDTVILSCSHGVGHQNDKTISLFSVINGSLVQWLYCLIIIKVYI